MYYQHFGLKQPPFKITPNTDFFFSGGNRGAVLDALMYAIINGEGIVKVVGEVGSGKTMLCRMLQTILPEKVESIYLANPSVAPEDILHAIAFELQLPVDKNANRLTVMQQLQTHLLNRYAEGRQVVIFVEEAQGMPLATLEEIRLLSNLETKQDKLLQIVLFGQPELDSNLNHTHIRQLRERITHSFHLAPLKTKDVGEYLIFRLRAAGYFGPHLFTKAAIKKLANATQGLVRRVNVLADKCLLAAYADNAYQVSPKHVKAAIQDSEFGAKSKNYNLFLWLSLLIVGVLAAASSVLWRQTQYQPKMATIKMMDAKITSKSMLNKPNEDPQAHETIQKSFETSSAASTNVAFNNDKAKNSVNQPNIEDSATPAIPTFISTAHLVDDRLEATKIWLAQMPTTTITLQVKTLLSKNSLKDEALINEMNQLAELLEIDNIYLYRKIEQETQSAVIFYGAFSTRKDAISALKNLPEQVKNYRPYLRTLAGINKDIEHSQ